MNYTGERAVPWNMRTGSHILSAHIARYAWAVGYCYGRRVVDIATGTGYGAYILSMAAQHVTGVDIDRQAIAYAQLRFSAPNLDYKQGDMTANLPRGEVYTAFECLEHTTHPDRVLEQIEGTLLYSVPVNDTSYYHKWAMGAAAIEARFGGEIFYQRLGVIVPKDKAWFEPEYVLGVVEL